MRLPRPFEPDPAATGGSSHARGGRPAASRRDVLRAAAVAGALGATGVTFPLASRALSELGSTRERPASPQAPLPVPPLAPLRPPATPLAVRSMYLSAWMPADSLPGTWPTFWNGRITAITGLVRVDGVTYTWCGAPSQNFPLAVQIGLAVTSTRSVYTLLAGPVTLTATFFSPVDPASLRRQCVPMSYITVTAAARDGGRHAVSVYLDISAEWAHGNDAEPVSWGQQVIGGLNVLTVTPSRPSVLAEYNDQASWGTVVWATDNVPGLSWQAGRDIVVRPSAASGRLADTSDPRQPRAINDDWPVFGFLRDLGTVSSAASAEVVVCLGHVRSPAVSYLGTALPPYWTTFWPSWPDMLTWFRGDLPAARQTCSATDTAVRRWAGEQPGIGTEAAAQYASITSLALRQAFGGTEPVVGPGGAPWAFLKEISSSGIVSTLDVIFPAAPAYLQLAPEYLRMLLAPYFHYIENGGFASPWAPHDLGPHYPNASGGRWPGGPRMPIEESGNILMLAAAVMARLPAADAAAYAKAHFPLFRQWASYLQSQEPDYPGVQNQTDDFTGVIAESVNLNLKGVIGVAAFSHIAGHAGQTADQAGAASAARSLMGRWASLAKDASAAHLDLSYGATGTYSLLYNAYPDRLLNINLISPAIQAEQAALYQSVARQYGVPLDSRHTYTKADWEMLTAAFLRPLPAARDMLIGELFSFLNRSPSRVPFTDWYDTAAGTQNGFQARPVVGGTFALDTLRSTSNGLTGHWSFHSDGALDLTGNAASLALEGGAAHTAGRRGRALALSGRGAHACAGRPVVRTDNSFTVTAWARLSRASGRHTVVSQDGRNVPAFCLQYSPARGRWVFAMTSADSAGSVLTQAASRGPAAVGAWVHLAGVHDAEARELRLYVDGTLNSAVAGPEAWNAGRAFHVGRGLRAGRPGDFFPGLIDEVRTYSRALSAAEIGSSAALPDYLLASYPAGEGTGATTADEVGGHTLRLAGAAWGPGFSGPGLSFDGASSAATARAFLRTDEDFSVSAWVRLRGTSGWQTAVSQDGNRMSSFALQYSPDDHAWAFTMVAADSPSARATRALAPLPPRVGDWQHLVGVHDRRARELRLYVDGRRAGTAAFGSAWNAAGPFVAGRGRCGGPAAWFSGSIDQIQVWSHALSDIDVSALV